MENKQPKTPFAKTVYILCLEHDETPSHVATEIGVSRQLLSTILNGAQNASDEVVRKIAEYFQLDAKAKRSLEYDAFRSRRSMKLLRANATDEEWALVCETMWRLPTMTTENMRQFTDMLKEM